MSQALVNKSLDNLVMGVSQQYQEGRKDGQVEELINCIPSITRGILRRNPIDKRVTLPNLSLVQDSLAFTYMYDRGNADEQYLFTIPGDSLGTWHVHNLNDVSKNWTGTNDYFKLPLGVVPKKAFKTITLRDATFVVNTTVEVKPSTTTNSLDIADYTDMAFYWIKAVTQVVIAQKTLGDDTGSKLEGYTYYLQGTAVKGEYAGAPYTPTVDRLSSDKIAEKLAADLGADYTHTPGSSFVVYKKSGLSDWIWEDSNGSLASLGVWETVNSSDELPATLPSTLDGFIVKVTGGTSFERDDYYLQYDSPSTTWNEVAKPGVSIGLDGSTMPHLLTRSVVSNNIEFTVGEYTEWGERVVGDLLTNKDPSFVGHTISELFFYKNRLGFLSNNKVNMSTIKDYGGFYIRTLKTILDDGPIDMVVATKDSISLTSAVATEDTLVVFDADNQFLLHSSNTPLTPNSAAITALSNYSFNTNMPAVGVGNNIYFSSVMGDYSQIFTMNISSRDITNINAEAQNISLHLPTYLNRGLITTVGDTGVGQVFFQTEEISNILYVLNKTRVQEQDVQLAFHTWLFEDAFDGIGIINNRLYIVFSDGSLGQLELAIPGDITTVDYQDKRVDTTYDQYTSGLEFSRFYYKGQSVKGTPRGRLQLRTLQYEVAPDSYYTTILSNSVDYPQETSPTLYGPIWEDLDVWDDSLFWKDADPYYLRKYKNDKKITVMSSADKVKTIFTANSDNPNKGFELQTVNYEALFYQRSTRVVK